MPTDPIPDPPAEPTPDDYRDMRNRMIERVREAARRIEDRVRSVRETQSDGESQPTEETKEQPSLPGP